MRKLFLFILFLVFSCKSDEAPDLKYPEFYFFNNSGVDIELVTYRNQRFDAKRFDIPSEKGKNLLLIGYDESVPKDRVPTGFPPLPYATDYILVIFNRQDSIFHSKGFPTSNSLYDENSYEFIMLENIPSYDYYFTEEDYEKAK